jgi:hypothetical protein
MTSETTAVFPAQRDGFRLHLAWNAGVLIGRHVDAIALPDDMTLR